MRTGFKVTLAMTTKEKFAKQLGRRLAQVRRAQGVTQTELARELGLSQAVIAEYESGRKSIPVWRMINLAEVLGVSPQVLISDFDSTEIKRGPTSKLQKHIEKISNLPREQQKSILNVLDMALQST